MGSSRAHSNLRDQGEEVMRVAKGGEARTVSEMRWVRLPLLFFFGPSPSPVLFVRPNQCMVQVLCRNRVDTHTLTPQVVAQVPGKNRPYVMGWSTPLFGPTLFACKGSGRMGSATTGSMPSNFRPPPFRWRFCAGGQSVEGGASRRVDKRSRGV
jgi:hypothetical protein